jgi:hypothetical protein
LGSGPRRARSKKLIKAEFWGSRPRRARSKKLIFEEEPELKEPEIGCHPRVGAQTMVADAGARRGARTGSIDTEFSGATWIIRREYASF